MEAEGERRPFKCFLDTGLVKTSTGARVFAALKGAVDGGLDIPHNDKRYAGYDLQDKSLDSETLERYIKGGVVAEYAEEMQEEVSSSFTPLYHSLTPHNNTRTHHRNSRGAGCRWPPGGLLFFLASFLPFLGLERLQRGVRGVGKSWRTSNRWLVWIHRGARRCVDQVATPSREGQTRGASPGGEWGLARDSENTRGGLNERFLSLG